MYFMYVRCTVCCYFFFFLLVFSCAPDLLLDSYTYISNIHTCKSRFSGSVLFTLRVCARAFFSFAFIPLQFIWTCSNSIEFMRLRIYFSLCFRSFFWLYITAISLFHTHTHSSLSFVFSVKFNR